MIQARRTTLFALFALFLLLAFAALTIGAAIELDETADEPLLWKSGRSIVNTGRWVETETTFQGPLPLYANQLLTRGEHEYDENGPLFTPAVRTRARLGMLPFGLLCGWIVFRFARRLFGDAGGLLALATYVFHPLAFGYAALVAVDMAHAALALLALDLLSSHAQDPRVLRRVLAGAALGLALATKYLAVLLAPVAVAFASWHAARAAAAEGRSKALRAGAGAALLVTLAALVALHAAYGFLPGGASASPEDYESSLLRSWTSVPVLGELLRVLPAPMAHGLDYQLAMGANASLTYFRGSYAEGHFLYYIAALATKTPEALLAAAAAVVLLGFPRWLGRRADPRVRDAVLILVAAGGVPFLYLSAFSTLQVGVRYVLPLVPIGCVLAGGLATLPEVARLGRRARLVLAGAYVALAAAATLGAWPNGPGYFNAISGGPAVAWRRFNDSNSDWGQMRDRGLAELRRRAGDEPLIELLRGHGPRMGRVAIYVRFRTPPDPLDPSRAHHWLDALEPVDHLDAAWLVYEVDSDAWREAADRDPRARAELAVALAGDGRLAEARAEVGALAAELRGPLEALLERIERVRAAPDDPAARLELAAAWLAHGREDLAEALLSAPDWPAAAADERAEAARAPLLAEALLRAERLADATRVLEARGEALGREPSSLLLLAELYRRAHRADDGAALLTRHLSALHGDDRARAEAALARARIDHAAWETYRRSLWEAE